MGTVFFSSAILGMHESTARTSQKISPRKKRHNTLPETKIGPENRPSQKDTSIPDENVSFREGKALNYLPPNHDLIQGHPPPRSNKAPFFSGPWWFITPEFRPGNFPLGVVVALGSIYPCIAKWPKTLKAPLWKDMKKIGGILFISHCLPEFLKVPRGRGWVDWS